jgi:hypothetical protein
MHLETKFADALADVLDFFFRGVLPHRDDHDRLSSPTKKPTQREWAGPGILFFFQVQANATLPLRGQAPEAVTKAERAGVGLQHKTRSV